MGVGGSVPQRSTQRLLLAGLSDRAASNRETCVSATAVRPLAQLGSLVLCWSALELSVLQRWDVTRWPARPLS